MQGTAAARSMAASTARICTPRFPAAAATPTPHPPPPPGPVALAIIVEPRSSALSAGGGCGGCGGCGSGSGGWSELRIPWSELRIPVRVSWGYQRAKPREWSAGERDRVRMYEREEARERGERENERERASERVRERASEHQRESERAMHAAHGCLMQRAQCKWS